MRLSLLAFLRSLWLAALLASLTASAPVWAKAEKQGKNDPPAKHQLAAKRQSEKAPAPHPAIWLLADEDTKIYLLGTIHVLPPGFRWRSPTIDRIIEEADELVVETYEEPGKSDHEDADQAAMLAEPVPILGRVPANRRAALKAAIAASGVPTKYYDRMQTWAAGMLLGMAQLLGDYGTDDPADAPGVEDRLEELFRAARKPISSVEDPAVVVTSLNALPAEVQVQLLLDTIAEPEPGEALSAADDDQLWASGDVDAMAADFLRDFPPALFDALLRRRNQAWTGWLANRLDKPGIVLFAVGAGHFAGEESVTRMLGRRGFAVTRVD